MNVHQSIFILKKTSGHVYMVLKLQHYSL